MAYSELIKNFSKIRDYMRQFYVYGFRKRDEYDRRSARSYDDERRRIESWLGEYMSFRQESSGKITFISVDSGRVRSNPLYKAFKAKSFTSNDIVLSFCILDILQEGVRMSVSEITDIIAEEYMSAFETPKVFDEAVVRNKLKEYAEEGLLQKTKEGRRVLYERSADTVDPEAWKEAVAFYSEADPLGVIGSFLLDRLPESPDYFRFKHHYLLYALESDILCSLLEAITDDLDAEIEVRGRRHDGLRRYHVLPLRILLSTENGRGYLLALEREHRRFNLYRLDRIESVKKEGPADGKENVLPGAEEFMRFLWNASGGDDQTPQHLEMVVRAKPEEFFIPQRLEREGRHGALEKIDEERYRFSIDVYDAAEMRPWLRTFIGRIESLTCSDPEVTKVFYEDLDAMYAMYGGAEDAVQ